MTTYTYDNVDKTEIRCSDGRCIPVCPGNRDYDALMSDGVGIADYALTTAEKMAALRATRDTLIVATNWLVERHRDEQDAVKTTTLTTAQYATLLTYRQALRDVPAQSGAPDTVTWPTKPEI